MSPAPLVGAAPAGVAPRRAQEAPPRPSVGRRVTRDSLWILSGYAVTSGAGFVFWIVAARTVSPERLGVDTAVYSAVTAAAAIASSGVGNALLVTISSDGRHGASALRLGLAIAALVALLAGLGAGLGVAALVDPGASPVATVVAVALAVVVWTAFVLKDPVLTALGAAKWLLVMNGPVNVAKLAVLPVVVVALGTLGSPIVVAALLPATVAVAIAWGVLVPRRLGVVVGDREPLALSEPERRSFRAFVLRDGTANGLYMGGALLLPFVVTTFAGASEGALFALCFQIGLVLDLVVVSVGTSLIAHASSEQGLVGAVAFRTWLVVLGVVAVAATCLVVASPLLLSLLGPFYATPEGSLVLALLAGASVVRTAYEVWGSQQRARRRTTPVLICSVASTAVLVPGAVLAAGAGGAVGVAVLVLGVTLGLAVVGVVGLARSRRVLEVAS